MGAELLRIGETVQRGEISFTARRKETGIVVPEVRPNLVALHEAAHVLVALVTGTASVHSADIIPNGPIQGTTYLSNFSLLVAAAGATLDREGAGGDRMIAAMQGVTESQWNTAVHEAAQIINANKELLYKLARAIEGWGSVDGGSLSSIFSQTKEGDKFVFTITAANGNAREVETRAQSGAKEISVPPEVYAIIQEIARKKEEENRKKNRGNVIPFPGMLTQRDIPRLNDVMTERSFTPKPANNA